jgi:hypothetical protein
MTQSITASAPLIDTQRYFGHCHLTNADDRDADLSHVPTLLAVSPGVVAQDQNNNIVRPWSYIGASSFTADGGRNNIYSNNFQLDGMPNTKAGGYVAFIPPMDSLQEFRVQTNAYDASIGRQAGATINMESKSGTKGYHGLVYWFNQNNILNAKLFQTNLVNGAKPPVHFNEPGGTFGGPVWIPRIYNGKHSSSSPMIDPHRRSAYRQHALVPTALERTEISASHSLRSPASFPIQVFDPLGGCQWQSHAVFGRHHSQSAHQSNFPEDIVICSAAEHGKRSDRQRPEQFRCRVGRQQHDPHGFGPRGSGVEQFEQQLCDGALEPSGAEFRQLFRKHSHRAGPGPRLQERRIRPRMDHKHRQHSGTAINHHPL